MRARLQDTECKYSGTVDCVKKIIRQASVLSIHLSKMELYLEIVEIDRLDVAGTRACPACTRGWARTWCTWCPTSASSSSPTSTWSTTGSETARLCDSDPAEDFMFPAFIAGETNTNSTNVYIGGKILMWFLQLSWRASAKLKPASGISSKVYHLDYSYLILLFTLLSISTTM